MSEPTQRRPFGVSLISLVMIVSGVLQVVGGIFFLVQRNDDDVLEAIDMTSNDMTALAIGSIIIGALAVVIGVALRRGESWARTLVGVIALVNLGFLVYTAIAYHSVHWYNVAWPALFYSLLAGYLFSDEDAKQFFA
jgi:drug/metabolite transporter (DMT)-like permease